MSDYPLLSDPQLFSSTLQEIMVLVNPGVAELEPYEFRYALDNLTPVSGWCSIERMSATQVEELIQPMDFFQSIQIKPVRGNHYVLDPQIEQLTLMLFTGLVTGEYSVEWVNRWFYFDLRGFFFLVRTRYYKPSILQHFGGKPYLQFEPTQQCFDHSHEIGYREFSRANQGIDRAFIDLFKKIIEEKETPLLLTLVGPTAAGKTEIVTRLGEEMRNNGKSINTIEMDNFFKDREFRDTRGMDREVIHYDLFKQSISDLKQGHSVSIPRYDFLNTVSSHDLQSRLRPGCSPITVEPAEIILLEGNFPFQLPEIAPLIDLKIVYLTDDPIRLKRKWKRDIDYRKKYDPICFCNRFFRTQRIRAEEIYLPLMEVCDMVVDTSGAAIWVAPEIVSSVPGGFSVAHNQLQ